MDCRLQELSELVQQAITETLKCFQEQERDEQKKRELMEQGAKLKAEIPDLEKEVAAERKKSAALTTRGKKLDRDITFWQQKLDSCEQQLQLLKSQLYGTPVVDDKNDGESESLAGGDDVSHVSSDLSQVLPANVSDTECTMWTVESAPSSGHRIPFSLPPMIQAPVPDSKHRIANGSPVRKKNASNKRKHTINDSESEEGPKKRVTRKRILDADGVAVSRPVSEFKKKCLELMASPKVKCEDDGTAGVVVESGMDWESSEEMAVIVAPKAGKQLDPKFTSHQFKQQNIITISRRIAQKDFEAKLQSICSCPNLRVLCMSGFGDLQNKEQTALNFLTEKLPSSCPKIRHFILDDGLLDLAIAYQETFPDNISVIEVRHVRPETEEAIIHLVTSGRSVQSVHLDHSSVHMIQEIVPVVRSLSLCWITDGEFKSLIKSCPSSDITELRLETVDLTMNSQRIEQLASVLPQLQLLKLSAQLENIGSLKAFRNLRHVIFDGECDSKPGISPFFEIDISHALQVSRQQDDGNEGPAEEDNRVDVQQSLTSQAGLDEFMINCGSNLVSFNITIRDRFKRDLFQHLKKSCPRLQELTILSTTEQFFDTKSLSVPSLRRLRFQFINMNDAKLVELLDYCRNLQFISIDKPQKITCASIKILALYSEDVFCENDERLIGNEKFTAIILTEGKEDMTRDLRTHCAQITYRQNAVVEVSNRLRYKY